MVSRCLCSIVLSALSVSVQKRETHETARRYNTSHLFTQTQLVDTREMGRRNSDKLIFVAQFPEDRPTSDRGINKPAPSLVGHRAGEAANFDATLFAISRRGFRQTMF